MTRTLTRAPRRSVRQARPAAGPGRLCAILSFIYLHNALILTLIVSAGAGQQRFGYLPSLETFGAREDASADGADGPVAGGGAGKGAAAPGTSAAGKAAAAGTSAPGGDAGAGVGGGLRGLLGGTGGLLGPSASGWMSSAQQHVSRYMN